MSSIDESVCLDSRFDEHPQNTIVQAINEYEERYDSD
jgi:hypothetical protein